MKVENVAKVQPRKITQNDIVKDLRKIGVKKGDHLAVALSFKSIGHVIGGPKAFIKALLETVDSNGTIMMPTFTRTCYIFDYKSTPAYTGLVPETFRKQKNSIRSRHPTNSVAAIGSLAEYLTIDHNEKSGAFSPYSKLAKVGGKVLCIGLGDNLIAIRHEAQNIAGLLKKVPIKIPIKYRNDNGEIKSSTRKDGGGCVKKLPELVPILREGGFVVDGKIGMADSILVPAKEALDNMADILRKKPYLNLCDNIFCYWCRELERRMNLYDQIDNPKLFQKSRSIINSIMVINWVRLKGARIIRIVLRILYMIKNIA
ncbi:AAC(3) family N-acetyltransferase [[Eubacterium] cellulosolvens]